MGNGGVHLLAGNWNLAFEVLKSVKSTDYDSQLFEVFQCLQHNLTEFGRCSYYLVLAYS